MTELEICKGCRWNHYPECLGTKDSNGFMMIDKLRIGFECGQKGLIELTDLSYIQKTESELKIEILETRLKILEDKE